VKDGNPTEEGHTDKLLELLLECHKYYHQDHDAGLRLGVPVSFVNCRKVIG
jgi:hypothetical protein